MTITETQKTAQLAADAAVSAAEAKQYMLEAEQGYQDTSAAAQQAQDAAGSALLSKQSAATSEEYSLQYATEAGVARDEAVASASTAAEFGDNKLTFADTTAGIAGTTSGQYFRVPQGVGNVLAFRYYKNNAGVAVEVAEYVGQGSISNSVREYLSLTAAQSDVTAGNILSGGYCWVRDSSDSTLANEYINNGGTLEATGRQMPSQGTINQALQTVFELIRANELDSFLFLAKNGVVGRLNGAGEFECYSVNVKEMKTGDVSITPGDYPFAVAASNGFLLTLDESAKLRGVEAEFIQAVLGGATIRKGRFAYDWQGSNGFLMTLDTDGKLTGIEADFQQIRLDGKDIKEVFSQSVVSEVYPGAPGILAGYVHTACYGQSQNIGTTNGIIHGVPFDSKSLMLNGGLRSYGTGGYDTSVSQANYYISMKPMYEISAGSTYGETYMSGHAIRARSFLDAAYPGLDVKKIYTVSGQGGAAISALIKGTAAYSRTLTQWVALINLVQSMGEAYRCASMIWSQGGTDDSLNTNPDTWEAVVRQMRADFTADIKSQTGLLVDPPYITNQINNYMRYPALNGKPNIGLRQYKMVTEADNDFYGSCPTYILDFIDVAHWTKESQVKVGAYNEKVERNLLLTGGTWKPVHPIKITTSGRFTTAKFNLPEGGTLQFNTEIVNEVPTTFGFSAEQPDGTAIGIDRVRLIASDTVEIRYTSTPLPGAVLMYGQTGQTGDPDATDGSGLGRQHGVRGNLCDNAGESDKIQINGIDYPLHNWCWMFTEDMGAE
ncbi:hypothetical protein JK332_11025 [Klebsiella michiganensis]|uniref:hypothetical protein n=1 Tax=Klebsiella michiganensis TaxID=1134687 RepID=UPI00191D00BF|nr:hypothetical protein [Klebsiella michiganensis]MBL0772286.1 hypothetical protein [Klebsiella michiganensis]